LTSKHRYPFLILAIGLLVFLSACNLQMSPALTPTIVVTQAQDVPPTLTPVPVGSTAQPTLAPPPLPTPTVGIVTPIPLGVGTPGLTGTGVPTLSAALADDRYEIQVRPNATIGVNYTVNVITGSVTFTLQGPDGVLWQKTITATENTRVEVVVQQGGLYEVLVDINNFDGNYSLSWG
jgi:hypothetical protein